jgi:hypothetical protein
MARQIRIINARDFVSAKPDGLLNLEESERVLREVDLLQKHPRTFAGRTAILCPNERFDHASFFALCAGNKGVDMQAFTSYEEAITWLNR